MSSVDFTKKLPQRAAQPKHTGKKNNSTQQFQRNSATYSKPCVREKIQKSTIFLIFLNQFLLNIDAGGAFRSRRGSFAPGHSTCNNPEFSESRENSDRNLFLLMAVVAKGNAVLQY